MPCFACKTAEIKNNTCPNCGKFIFTETEVDLILSNSNRRTTVRISCSDRYMIIHKAKHFEKSNNGLGIIGGAVVSAVVLTAKDGKMPYGFYGLHEMQKVIFPYKNRKLKKDRAIKIIFRDGSDMILVLWGDMLPKLRDLFENQDIEIVDGINLDHGDTYCIKPIVNDDTVGLRVCADIAPHIKMMKGNFVAPVMAGAPAPKVVAPPAPKPAAPAAPKPAAPKAITTVAELNLSVKTYNMLLRLGVDQLPELTVCSREALLVNGFTESQVAEIEARLQANGLSLTKKREHVKPAAPVVPAPKPVEPAPAPAPKPVESAPVASAPVAPAPQSEAQQSVERFDQVFDAGLSRVMEIASSTREELLAKGMSPEDVDELEDVLEDHGLSLAEPEIPARPEKIEELELGIMPFAHLFKLEITTVDQLVALSREELLGKGVDEWNLDQIEARLGAFGLCLAQPAPIAEPVPVAEPAPVAEPVRIPEPAPAPVVEHKREEAPAIPKRDPNVKFCRNCGAKLRRSDNFCVECGADQR